LRGTNAPYSSYPTASGGSGLVVYSSKVAIHDSSIRGGNGGTPWPGEEAGHGGHGCHATGGATFIHSSGSSFRGGHGAHGWRATDCDDEPATPGGNGGHGIYVWGN